MTSATIERFMTRAPYTIGFHQTLAAAHRLMSEHGIRHLPVLESGKLVGIVSQRDLHLIETLRGVEPGEVEVNEAMTPVPYTVSPRSSLSRVASEMAEHRYGSAVVLEKDRVVGVFTTVDALRALFTLLGEERGTHVVAGRERARTASQSPRSGERRRAQIKPARL